MQNHVDTVQIGPQGFHRKLWVSTVSTILSRMLDFNLTDKLRIPWMWVNHAEATQIKRKGKTKAF